MRSPSHARRTHSFVSFLYAVASLAGCGSAGSVRSTAVAESSYGAARGGTAEASWTAGGYRGGGGRAGDHGSGPGRDDDLDVGSVTTISGLASSEYALEDEALDSYEIDSSTALDSYPGVSTPAEPAPVYASLPPPAERSSVPASETVVARAGGETRGETYADASRVIASAGAIGDAIAETATDASPGGTLLIYTAGIWLAVYEVRESQATIVERAEALGGFVQRQTDQELVVRVPARQFDALVEAISGVGDLLHREIAAADVSEEFHDVEIRIQNLEAMRQRLEVLLTQATAVEDALRVERELERVTVELERLRGRQRFLTDRIALATITIHFEARPRDRIEQPEIFALPFYWLQNLGLPRLLELN